VKAGIKRGHFIQTALQKDLFGWSGGAEAALWKEPLIEDATILFVNSAEECDK